MGQVNCWPAQGCRYAAPLLSCPFDPSLDFPSDFAHRQNCQPTSAESYVGQGCPRRRPRIRPRGVMEWLKPWAIQLGHFIAHVSSERRRFWVTYGLSCSTALKRKVLASFATIFFIC